MFLFLAHSANGNRYGVLFPNNKGLLRPTFSPPYIFTWCDNHESANDLSHRGLICACATYLSRTDRNSFLVIYIPEDTYSSGKEWLSQHHNMYQYYDLLVSLLANQILKIVRVRAPASLSSRVCASTCLLAGKCRKVAEIEVENQKYYYL